MLQRPDSYSSCQVSDHITSLQVSLISCTLLARAAEELTLGRVFSKTSFPALHLGSIVISTQNCVVCYSLVSPLGGDSEKDKLLATQRDNFVYKVKINDFIWAFMSLLALKATNSLVITSKQ